MVFIRGLKMGAPWTPSLQNHLSNSNGNIFCNWVSSFTKTSLPYALVKSTHDCCFNPTNFGWSIHMLDICWRSQLHGFPITPGMATKWMSTKKPSSLLELSQVNSAKKHDKFGSWSQQKWSFTKEKPDTRPGKHTKNYGKSPLFMGKSIVNGHFPVRKL